TMGNLVVTIYPDGHREIHISINGLFTKEQLLNSFILQDGDIIIDDTAPIDNPPIINENLIASVKGLAANNMLGYSVMSAKNIKGSGLNDIVISAPSSSAGTDIGKAYIYFGGDITKPADMILSGFSGGGCFGYSMAAGDINGDGYDDIVISEPYNDETGMDAGRIYVYFGGASLSNYPDAILQGQTAGDMFGYSVNCRDMNNDNHDDIIVGAPYSGSNGVNAGKVYIYFGGHSVDSTPDLAMTGVTGDLFGYSMASGRNIDGNNNSGIIVGAPGLSANTDRPGKAYTYYGGDSVDNIADIIMAGQVNGDLFGCSVSAGDFNGDGCDDVIVGAEKNSSATGKAYIYWGGKNTSSAASLTMIGEAVNDEFGHLVSCAGDINGDGYSDIIAASPNNTSVTGKTYLYFGGLFMDNTAEATIKGESVGDNFGSSISSAGDSNNDGIDEFIIGAANNSLNGANAGKAYLYKIACSGQPTRTADALLDETEAKACKYFYDQILTTPGANGLVKDTCYTNYSSTAATGFGLTALCIMANRHGSSPYWTITPAQAQDRVSAALDTLINIQNNQPGQEDYYGKEGFFFHFIGPDGKREASMNSEVSTVDTALLLAGVITAGKYFGGDIQAKANTIFNAVNWNYFLDTSDGQYYHGWSPDYGLIQQTWDRPSDETLLISLLAIASDPTNQDFLKAYYGFPRSKNSYASASQTFYVYNSYSGSLFTYIFAHCWYDFKKAGIDIPDNVQGARFAVPVNWWENSKTAAQANRQFCIDNAATYSSYSQNDWGLSACFRPDRSYFGMNGAPPREYVAPGGGEPANDGTVPPYGAISAIPLMKDLETNGLPSNLSYQALEHYYNDYYFRLWGPYGPRDSFDQSKKFSTIYAGINLGPIALMIENYRSELLWNTFMADSKIAQVTQNLFTDTMAPVINQFSVSNPDSPTAGYTNSATVNVSIDGSDAGGITRWLITEISTQPPVSSFVLNSKPATYTIVSTGNGLKRLYAWAIDAANNISLLNTNSQAQIYLDITAPNVGTVAIDGPYTASSIQLHAKWSGNDAESGVIEYQYRITDGSATGTVIRDWASSGTVPEVTATGLTLTQNHTYYFSVKAKNGAGSWSATQYSAGITYNPFVPDVTAVNPNDGAFGYASTSVSVYPTINNPIGSLQYQFTIKGVIKQAWTAISTYSWAAAQSDVGSADIMIEVKNQYGTNYRTGTICLVQPPITPPAN
ncbi:MAG: glucoamylase family protein, partial [Candidatus Omnitrophota bacterium]|nr:glucoamylase family protein [Candidatus Omnitrophota bacterium]